MAELNDRIGSHIAQVQASLDPSNPAVRAAALTEMYQRLIDNRERFELEDISARLVEFPGLFPIQ